MSDTQLNTAIGEQVYLSRETSDYFRVAYDNTGCTTGIAKSALQRLMPHPDEYHQQVFEAIKGDRVLKLIGVGFGWWLIAEV